MDYSTDGQRQGRHGLAPLCLSTVSAYRYDCVHCNNMHAWARLIQRCTRSSISTSHIGGWCSPHAAGNMCWKMRVWSWAYGHSSCTLDQIAGKINQHLGIGHAPKEQGQVHIMYMDQLQHPHHTTKHVEGLMQLDRVVCCSAIIRALVLLQLAIEYYFRSLTFFFRLNSMC